MANSGYRAFLRSDYWQNQRLKKLASRRALCCMCLRRFPVHELNVHHLTYGPSLREVAFRELRVLCMRCHEFFHEVEKLYEDDPMTQTTPRLRWHFLLKKCQMIRDNERVLPMEPGWASRLNPV